MKTISTTYHRLLRTVLYAFFATVLLSSCYRDDLCYLHPDGAVIELKIDWSYAKLQPNSATAIIYKDNVYYRTEIFSVYPPVQKRVYLPEGNYSIVVFDEQMSDYEKSLQFSGMNRWETFEVRAIDDYIANFYTKVPSRTLKAEVDTLAVDRIMNFEVTPDMIHYAHLNPTPLEKAGPYSEVAHTINFLPKRVFTIAEVVLKVKNGAGYFFTQRNPAVLHGTSESYFPGIHKYSEHPVSHPVKFTQLITRTENDVVYYSSTLHLVGLTDFQDPTIPAGSFSYNMTLPFTYSGGIIFKEINLNEEAKNFIYKYEPDHDLPYDYAYFEIEVELPPLVIIGGMDATLEDWTEVDVPLDGPQRLNFLANNGSNEVFWWQNLPGVVVNLPSPLLFSPVEGLEFREWNSEPDGSGTSFIPGDPFEMKRGGFMFYAIWNRTDLPLQTLYFIANNGTDEQITSRQKPGVLIPIPDNPFLAPVGKQFKEWNSKANGTGTAYAPQETFRVKQEDNRFYAIWK